MAHAARCPDSCTGNDAQSVVVDQLANGSEEVWIEGGGQLYRLRQTKQNN